MSRTLFVAHPGHELFAHGWLRAERPSLCVLTEGSGHADEPRIGETGALAASVGCARGPIWGRFRDRDLYGLLLERAFEPLAEVVETLADFLVETRVEVVVTDAHERQILAHDVCSLLGEWAVGIARVREREVRWHELPIYGYHGERPSTPSGEPIELLLDDEAFEAKRGATAFYAGTALRDEIRHFVARRGEAAFRRERFPAARPGDLVREEAGKPAWELHGEAQQRAGRYASVIRFEQHLLPLMAFLERRFGSQLRRAG